MLTADDYAQAYAYEVGHTYPVIDALEARLGFALSPERYLPAAQVLACPIKRTKEGHFRHIALWQHGRVLYAVAREFARWWTSASPLLTLDIGTAKGYSALCVLWALEDAGIKAEVHSVDVLDPRLPVVRHTVAEVDGLKSLAEILAPWPETQRITFHQSPGIDWLQAHTGRLPFVYVDGKHTGDVPKREAALIRERQQPGDVAVFDDVQIPDVAKALEGLTGYDIEYVRPLSTRAYAIARRQ